MTKWTEHREGPVSDLCDCLMQELETKVAPLWRALIHQFTYVLGEGHEGR